MANQDGWIGVDLDGTTAKYNGWKGVDHVGEPIPLMVSRIKQWRAEGKEVRIFTARVYPINMCVTPEMVFPPVNDEAIQSSIRAIEAIRKWCKLHIGEVLPVTNLKDYAMLEIWDDRAVGVRFNTGERIG